MKTRGFITGIAIAFPLIMTGCMGKTQEKHHPLFMDSGLKGSQTGTAREILQHYYELKDGLVQTDAEKAIYGAQLMKNAVMKLKEQLTADSLQYALTVEPGLEKEDSLLVQLDQLIAAKSDDCEKMRIYFKPVSDLVYGFLKDIRITGTQTYHHYCPMAMNEKGAYWLSTSPEIENPYFGQKMLTCGELVDTIK